MRKTMIAACAGMLAACSMPVLPPAPSAPAVSAVRPAPSALAGEGRYAEAIALLEEGVQRAPSAASLGDLGYAYYLGGQLEQAQAALERACLLEPSSAVAWERLAALMEAMGETGRAVEAMRHARTLREAAGGRGEAGPASDVAGSGTPGGLTGSPSRAAQGGDLWPAGMAQVEVRQVHAGMVEVARVERAGARQPVAPERAAPAMAPATAAASALPRLEVSNGNGIRGMAAAVAQRLRAQGMQVVRLTNTIPFNVQETRVEVRGSGEPQLRIVLGRDAEIKKPPAVSRRQAP
ncbi:hypothetical protein GM658_04480 [Pseudoduganella eburnea]|uniref:LytR/CpsA/Psr regulator C-terminal domain-containing protein n=1 Tax=Massilia eburnea TaxID=1776165 RepID=A0A6L6QDD3_9BURK|nr:LytR C-terminal domain-containing protein [Massilia eburnea]MTW09847.1 hypothetical protein [Massilia eburnea]